MEASHWPVEILSHSAADTRRRGAQLATLFAPGDVICLEGDLGAGKTTFVAGFAEALGSEVAATSPSFTLENRYPLPGPGAAEILHVDLYRLEEGVPQDLLGSMLEARQDGARVLVEWAAPVQPFLEPCLQLRITLEPRREHGEPLRRLRLSCVPKAAMEASSFHRLWGSEETTP